jgi:hypothetical protein
LLKSFSILFLLILSVFSAGSSLEGNYSVKIFPYSGSSEIYFSIEKDTLLIDFNTKVALNTVKINNHAKMLLSPLKPVSIYSDYSKIGKKSTGYLLFSDTMIEAYASNARIKSKQIKAKYQPNDWLILPFFLMHYTDSIYKCSMIHGDFTFRKNEIDNRIEWMSEDKRIKVIFKDSVLTYLKADKIEMIRAGG